MQCLPTIHPNLTRAIAREIPHPDEVAAWVDEVGPVLTAMETGVSRNSVGRHRWLLEQIECAERAADDLCFLLADARSDACGDEDHTSRVEDLEWLATRVCAVADRLTRVESSTCAAA